MEINDIKIQVQNEMKKQHAPWKKYKHLNI